MSKTIKLYNESTNPRLLEQCVEVFQSGGVVIYPTDSVYAMGVSIHSQKGIEKLRKLKGVKRGEHPFTMICAHLSSLSQYVEQMTQSQFKLLKNHFPGPFTFILKTHKKFPKKIDLKRKTIGVRVPDHSVLQQILEQLEGPILSTSLKSENGIIEYSTDPELITEEWQSKVDLIIDGGYGNDEGSTVVDLTDDDPVIIRQGIGHLS